jgi:hypothetical protein
MVANAAVLLCACDVAVFTNYNVAFNKMIRSCVLKTLIITGRAVATGCSMGDASAKISVIYLLTTWCRTLFEKLIVTQIVKKYPAFFMEPEGSLPCSQKPATGPYPEPAESSSPHRSLSP